MRLLFGSIAFVGSALLATSPAFSAKEKQDINPLKIIVSLNEQQMTVYRGTEVVASSNISSGKRGHATPTGIFSIMEKRRHHRSNIYRGARMPYMQRLTWSGIALHESHSVPSHPASHGCVRMPRGFAAKLFKMDTRGVHVVIEDDPRAPRKISSIDLPQPKMTWQTDDDLDRWVNAAIEKQNLGYVSPDERYPSRILITRRTYKADLIETQRLLNKLDYDAGVVDGIMGPATWKAISRYRADKELEGSRTAVDNELLTALYADAGEVRPPNGRLMVRQHQRTVYETPVNFKDPHLPLGSHLLTTYNLDRKAGATEWMVTSLEDRIQQQITLQSGAEVDQSTSRVSAERTLSRIQMTGKAKRQLARFLVPGSSIAISDNGLSIETGARGTDFIVLTDPKEPELQAKVDG